MIVAFGFTGVSTALTVMSDIEVLDITTWSWTSVYTPSPGYNTGGSGASGKENGIGGRPGNNVPSSPSISIVAGAVTGGLVVFVLILVAFYFLNSHHQRQRNRRNNKNGDFSTNHSSSDLSQHMHHRPSTNQHEMVEISFKGPVSPTEPFEYYNNQSRRPSAQTPHPLQINTSGLPTRSDTINTSTTVVTNASSVILLPSPWSRVISEDDNTNTSSSSSSSSDWMIRRAASTPTHHPMQSLSISKPDDISYPALTTNQSNLRRAVTVSELNNSKSSISLSTNNSSTATITNKNVPKEIPTNNTNNNHNTTAININNTQSLEVNNNIHISINNKEEESGSDGSCGGGGEDNEDDDDDRFDRQEFILRSDEVAKIE